MGDNDQRNVGPQEFLAAIRDGLALSLGPWASLYVIHLDAGLRSEHGDSLDPIDQLGLVTHGFMSQLANFVLPRNRPFRNADLGLVEEIAVGHVFGVLPERFTRAAIVVEADVGSGLSGKLWNWWSSWKPTLAEREDSSGKLANEVRKAQQGLFLATIEEIVREVWKGVKLSKRADELMHEEGGDPGPDADRDNLAAERLVLGHVWELLEPKGSSADSGIWFTGADGRVRVGRYQVRDKLGKRGMEEKPKQSLDQDVAPDEGGDTAPESLHSLLPEEIKGFIWNAKAISDKREGPELGPKKMGRKPSEHALLLQTVRSAQEAREARELNQLLRERLAAATDQATREVDRVIALHLLDLSCGELSLKELSIQSKIPMSTLSEAKKRLVARLEQDPPFRGLGL